MKIENVNKDSLKILFCCDIIILETKRRHFDVSHVHTAPLHMLSPPPLFHFILPFFSFLHRHNSGGMQPVALSKYKLCKCNSCGLHQSVCGYNRTKSTFFLNANRFHYSGSGQRYRFYSQGRYLCLYEDNRIKKDK